LTFIFINRHYINILYVHAIVNTKCYNNNVKSFYYLHVSKASGRFLYTYVLADLIEITRGSDIEYLFPPSSDPNWTHHGWNNLISDDTYIISSLRDPVEAIVSYRIHHGGLADKEHLMETINKVTNIQYRSFLHWDDNRVDPHKEVVFDKDLMISRLNRVNMLLESKDINILNYKKIKKAIADNVGISGVSYENTYEDTNRFKSAGVKEFCDSLTEAERDRIKEVNYMDVELYEAAKSLFFPI
jgi:hypothetical protein